MKVNDDEKKLLSEAIDKMNEGLDSFIEFYNDSEEDKAIIEFSEETIKSIEKAIEVYGKEEVTSKINTIVKEVLSFLPTKKDDSSGKNK
ncbi:atypical membrane-integrating protein (Mistic protein) [Metabacillus litoralis]|uniref:atypical membrane-integrating protein (Mistic protein) n=1 Tax=Metabacillus litoralis TaxID=152268 RepID=UPI001CFDB312|nr:atypical membrane-integrating protein (Mistic protein) [Metabacillus litoralis]